MWFYPWREWLTGPWDLFIEHGHRLLGSLAGMLAIALVAAAWLGKTARYYKIMSAILLLAIIGQGILGGMRVEMDARRLAQLHGCLGPAVFAFAVALWTTASRRWHCETTSRRDTPKIDEQTDIAATDTATQLRNRWTWFAIGIVLFVYLQLVLGSLVRHAPVSLAPASFRLFAISHIVMGLATASLAVALALRGRQTFVKSHDRFVGGKGTTLAAMVVIQLLLGLGTWISKYSWPAWLRWIPGAEGYVVHADRGWQPWLVTAHVALGSLILAQAVVCSLWSARRAGWFNLVPDRTAPSPASATRQLFATNRCEVRG